MTADHSTRSPETDVRAVAIRFADLWAIDPHQMVDEIYATDIVMENMSNPARVIRGAAELHAVEDELAARIPDHRHELIRVIVDDRTACLETTVVAPVTGEYAPACVWWWLDAAGMVSTEVGWFDWSIRARDARISHGTVPPNAARSNTSPGPWRDRGWYEERAATYASTWATDPAGSARELFAPTCTSGRVGLPEQRGLDELIAGRLAFCEDLPPTNRRMDVHRILGDGSVLALLVTVGDAARCTRGTVVLTFDRDDRIISERSYLDLARAVDRSAARADGTVVGSPGWSPRE